MGVVPVLSLLLDSITPFHIVLGVDEPFLGTQVVTPDVLTVTPDVLTL